jgi:hypothetical protein
MGEEQYHITQKEMMKLKVISRVIDGTLTVKEAAELLVLSERLSAHTPGSWKLCLILHSHGDKYSL